MLAFFKAQVPHIDTPQDHAFFAGLYNFARSQPVHLVVSHDGEQIEHAADCTCDTMTHMERTVRKAVFPAAGLGTRFLPATEAQPKEMLVVVDKPVIQYGVEEAVQSGVTNIVIVTGRGKNAIEDHFDVSYELERHLAQRGDTCVLEQVRAISSMINVSYVRQGEQLGLGHAVLQARDLVGDESFAVMLGDDIIDSPVPCMKQMIDVFGRHGGPVIAVQQVPKSEISAYGVIDGAPEGGRFPRLPAQ